MNSLGIKKILIFREIKIMRHLKTYFFLLAASLFATQAIGQKSSDPTFNQDEGTLLDVYIPNAFTPNMDNVNDVFKPVISGGPIEFYELVIIDRTGKEAFSSKNPSEVWDGTTPGSNYTSSPSLFLYILKVKAVDNLEYQVYKGHVTMVR